MDSDDEGPPDLVCVDGAVNDDSQENLEATSTHGGDTSALSAETSGEVQQALAPGAVPVTILTGFLGAGKTTLLNYILTQDHGRRIAVIENEFGDSMDIEELIARDGADGSTLEDNLFELKNGCICCTVKDDLVTTLETLLQRRNKFDYIIIETTGLANPGPVASVFWIDDALESALRLDGIVTLVDAKNISRQLERASPTESVGMEAPESKEKTQQESGGEGNEAAMQLAYADRILINKIDLISADTLDHVMGRVRAINAVAEVRYSERSVVDLAWVLDIKCFSSERALQMDSRSKPTGWSGSPLSSDGGDQGLDPANHDSHAGANGSCHRSDCTECAPPSHGEGQGGAETLSAHDSAVTTHAVEVAGSLELGRLERWLGSLVWEPEAGGMEVYRVKGVVSIRDRVERFVVQGVADMFEVAPTTVVGSAWKEEEARHCKMVFIGRNLLKDQLEQGVRACIAD